MPRLGKTTMTRYLGSECEKQLRILLSPESGKPSEREQLGMPPKQPPLPGLQKIAAAGNEWAASRLAELRDLVGENILIGVPKSGGDGLAFNTTPLEDALATAQPGTFLAEHQYSVDATFREAFGLDTLVTQHRLKFENLRPDLIEVRAPHPANPSAAPQHVNVDGSLDDLSTTDTRLQLRIIDIKLTSDPGPGYFAEVVYYSVALAGWLADQGWDDRFVVSADPAIWPGSHEASALAQAINAAKNNSTSLTETEAIRAVYDDLEPAPVPVFIATLRHFFEDVMPRVLDTNWRDLRFHVSGKCRGCDFLGEDRGTNNQPSPDHCLPTAEASEHLSRIPFLSRGASGLLQVSGVDTISEVARRPPADEVFNQHHSLRAQRTVISGRADALANGTITGVVPRAGTSATLPKWSDLNIYITADFDASSATTLVFGATAYWSEPRPFGTPYDPETANYQAWNRHKSIIVKDKSLLAEQRSLIQFLERIDEILTHVKHEDRQRGGRESTVQIYLWDDLTYRHLTRVIGRHLDQVLAHREGVRLLAWLFPPEELLANARSIADPVVTIVGDAVRSLVALPIPHHYSLLETARMYHSAGLDPQVAKFTMPFHHEVFLSDQIPSERAHSIWAADEQYVENVRRLDWAVGTRLQALEEVTKRLRTDLTSMAGLRRNAPNVSTIRPPERVSKLTGDELLLYAFTRLNTAVQVQDARRQRAMPPHEREARFASLRMTQRLNGNARLQALNDLDIEPKPSLDVYEVRPTSNQANFKPGDFTCALVPEDRVEILDWTLQRFLREQSTVDINSFAGEPYTSMSEILGATLVAFDRERSLAVIELNSWKASFRTTRNALAAANVLSLAANVSLEEVPKDFFSRKLLTTLQAVGNTPKALTSTISTRALGSSPNPRATARVPVEDVLWDASAMAATPVQRDISAARSVLEGIGRHLNDPQWEAFNHALTHRLTLIWGPPGTGKSRTVTNIVLGAAHDALTSGRPLRILVTAFTYAALDNVLNEVAPIAAELLPDVAIHRVRGQRDRANPPVIDTALDARNRSDKHQDLIERLTDPRTLVTVVGGSTQQVHRLATDGGTPTEPLFDLIIVDEASQMDVSNAVLPLATLAENGSVIIAGDPLQLPPIHQIDPPSGAGPLVGSIYDFLSEHHEVEGQELEINYRSNKEIVDLARDANYPPGLTAHSHSLRINLIDPVAATEQPPEQWPSTLPWKADLTRLLDPARPVTCLVYKNGLDGQSSQFEAQTVASLVWLLSNHLANQLDGEIGHDHTVRTASTAPYDPDELFRSGLGIVTPHRAQQSAIITGLSLVFPDADRTLIRDAVDTVERFQGQQRDVIIGSYAVGDPDTIAQEDEFLQSLKRFNVMASRARAKLIVLVSEELVQHLPTDIDVLRDSALLKAFANSRCRHHQRITLGAIEKDGAVRDVPGTFRWS